MPMRLDTETRTGALVAAVNEALVRHGPAGLTMRRIARLSGVSTSSILHHLDSREHLIRVCAHRTGRARLAEQQRRVPREGALAFLPDEVSAVYDLRAWLAWQELWRSEESLIRTMTDARNAEGAALAGIEEARAILTTHLGRIGSPESGSA